MNVIHWISYLCVCVSPTWLKANRKNCARRRHVNVTLDIQTFVVSNFVLLCCFCWRCLLTIRVYAMWTSLLSRSWFVCTLFVIYRFKKFLVFSRTDVDLIRLLHINSDVYTVLCLYCKWFIARSFSPSWAWYTYRFTKRLHISWLITILQLAFSSKISLIRTNRGNIGCKSVKLQIM